MIMVVPLIYIVPPVTCAIVSVLFLLFVYVILRWNRRGDNDEFMNQEIILKQALMSTTEIVKNVGTDYLKLPSNGLSRSSSSSSFLDNSPIEFTLPTNEVRIKLCDSCVDGCHNHQHDIGEIEPMLYQFSDDDHQDSALPPSSTGRLWFAVIYDPTVEQLIVNLANITYPPCKSRRNSSRDVFVSLFVHPDFENHRQSKIRRKSKTPSWNEEFVFQIPPNEVRSRRLRFSVCEIDRRRNRKLLGQVVVNLAEISLNKTDLIWRDLQVDYQAALDLGRIQFSLCFTPENHKLKIVVLEAKDIRKMICEGIQIKVQLMQRRKVIKCKKTSVVRGTCDPIFNEAFVFNIASDHMEMTSIMLKFVRSPSSKLGSSSHDYGFVNTGPFMLFTPGLCRNRTTGHMSRLLRPLGATESSTNIRMTNYE
ncbi:synaptotagmin-15-like [Anneissia japonica]|uniref:synaptotagmin-15-like n=1 Tax=Anneissia japonica TaxID=1529436 RepID=UPI001425926E|nr:synaptotagmin-15-like [Anneissia japonica]